MSAAADPGASLRDHLAPLLAAHAAAGRRIGIAVSGGGDSLALLDLCAGIDHGILEAVTLDHGLRPEAAAEAAMVASYCRSRGIGHATLHWQGWAGAGNLQAAARGARYRLIADWAQAAGLAEVWLGHTLDDVAETLLIRLGRAAGLDGLARMAPVFEREGQHWRRPLLGVGRAALRRHLQDQGLVWAEDPSNSDRHYARVRAREALALLAPLGISAESLARSATALADSRSLLEQGLAREWGARSRVLMESGELLLDLGGAAPDLRRRLLRAALQRVGGEVWPARQSALEDLEQRLAVAPRHTLAGCLVSRTDGGLRFTREWRAVRDCVVPLGVEFSADCGAAAWDGRWQICGPADGERSAGLELRALGQGIALCPDWRASGLPRAALMAGPAVWRGETLVAAPLARNGAGWSAKLRASFASCPFAH